MNRSHLEYLASPAWAERLRADLVPWIERVADLGDDVLEVGPGPGLTTDLLRERAGRVTAVELDDALATKLALRLATSNVEVVTGDATRLAFEADRFSAVTAFSMLHHVPTAEQQDAILREACRVLRPGGGLFATDARDLDAIRQGHEDDTFVPLPPETLVGRLEAAGFSDVQIEVGDYEIRFSARKAAVRGA
jgi:ubiquinone/menaquinone biosynthesis C-methylase UbiE